jgi:hypothetical protein
LDLSVESPKFLLEILLLVVILPTSIRLALSLL